ncbi:hypothetical protein [Rhizomicrobium electricum]|uniref:TonB C-terminal domain-containing protein n=1 Tax=Rhizomicrobium electricum TaxID=480070 RepID=A0ABN1FCY1_9PROT|nr:hypothetical protein [Rhizomicrobium electricum]NIJ49158.1 hypothetical protein [Rhizomicrobium electricum]
MTVSKFGLTAIVFAAVVTAPVCAGDLTEVFHSCVAKFARSTQDATVTLECTAADGKVSGCKVLNAPTPSNGFDKAALCVADALPIGGKTGTISFPIKFEKNHF